MLKTKSKAASTEVSVTAVSEDPRAAMKLVRKEVKQAVKLNHRVDQMGYNGPDIARSQIALQDMLTHEQEKRRKAEEHIVNMKDMLEAVCETADFVITESTDRLRIQQEKVAQLSKANRNWEAEADQMAENWRDTATKLEACEVKLAAAMQTIKTMSEAVDFA
jgi:hypothetical protein